MSSRAPALARSLTTAGSPLPVSQLPMPIAAAPAAMNSCAFSIVTPVAQPISRTRTPSAS